MPKRIDHSDPDHCCSKDHEKVRTYCRLKKGRNKTKGKLQLQDPGESVLENVPENVPEKVTERLQEEKDVIIPVHNSNGYLG